MASNTTKKSTKKTNTKKTTKTTNRSKNTKGTKKQTNRQNNNQEFLGKEITIWVTLALCILLMISNFGVGGLLGDAVATFMQYLFGWVAYILPVCLFGGIAFVISNQGNRVAYVKTASGIVFLIFTCVFLQLVNDAGGQTGEMLIRGISPAIGIAGTYVVTVVLLLICVVLMTEKSILKGMKKQSEKAYGRAREDMQRYRDEHQERREIERARREEAQEERRQRRLERTVSGVSFDTTLKRNDAKEKVADEKNAADSVKKSRQTDKNDYIPELAEPFFEQKPEELVINRSMPVSAVELTPEPENMGDTEKASRKKNTEKVDIQKETEAVERAAAAAPVKRDYKYPPLELLKKGSKSGGDSDAELRETALKLQDTLRTFGVNVKMGDISCGPVVTRYELEPERGVKVSKILGLSDDIKLNLAATTIRIEAPIPGKAAVGIEIPNKEKAMVYLRNILESQEFKKSKSKLSIVVGQNISGDVVVSDIAKMPHLLVAGATGSGKSVYINTLIMSILYKATPDDVKMIMVDPKAVELSVYDGIPHLMIPVVTNPKKAAGALNWAVTEMERRYQLLAEYHVRDLKGYNEKIDHLDIPNDAPDKPKKLPQMVIIVDELADLMMVAPGEVEDAILRLAQKARAAGIHMVLATQRPSVDVITGLIKANMPSRIAFSVKSGVDSRTILDMNGAEKLLGNGDMLFLASGKSQPERVQGPYVSDDEVEKVVQFLKDCSGEVTYDEEIQNQVNHGVQVVGINGENSDERDSYFVEAGKLFIDKDKASIGMLQRVLRIGHNRACRIVDQLEEAGVVGPDEGTKPRKVLMSMEAFEQYIDECV